MTHQLKQHRMSYTTNVAKTAAEDVTHFLEDTWPQTVVVHNVEDNPIYQEHDIDLLWTVLERSGRLLGEFITRLDENFVDELAKAHEG